MIEITHWRSVVVAHDGQRQALTWQEFVAWMSPEPAPPFAGKHRGKETDADFFAGHPGWSPATFAEDYRAKSKIEAVHLLTFENDESKITEREQGPIVTAEQAAEILRARGLTSLIVTTKGHTPEKPHWRGVVLPSRPFTVAERDRLIDLAETWGLSLKRAESRNAACFWYTTSAGAHPDAGRAVVIEGAPLDVDQAIRQAPRRPAEPQAQPQAPPTPAANVDRYIARALESAYLEIATSPAGGHHTIAAQQAWAIGGLVGAGLVSRHEAERHLLAGIQSSWKPETQADAARTIRGQLKAGSAKPRAIPEARARSFVLSAVREGAVRRPADLAGQEDAPRLSDLHAAAGGLLAEGVLELQAGELRIVDPPDAPAEDEEREAIQAEGATVDRVAELFARLEAAGRKDRAQVVLSPDVLAWVAWLPEDAPAFLMLRAGLAARGVAVRSWAKAVRAAREAWGADVDRAPETPRDDPRPIVVVTTEEHETNDAAGDALASCEGIYQRGAMLVDIVRDAAPPSACRGLVRAPGAPRIRDLPAALLRDMLTRVARWKEWRTDPKTKTRALAAAHPPEWAVRALHQRGTWDGIPELAGVIEWPLVRPNGEILTSSGYDPTSGILYAPSPGADVAPFLEAPTQAAAVQAAGVLLAVVEDFPFATEIDRSAWLASLLTPLARHAFDGPAPLFAVSANIRGAGKTRLVRIASEIISGREPNLFGQLSGDEAEERKRITALAMGGDPLVLIDNVSGVFGGPMLDAALTSTFWSDRILGVSSNARLPLACTWYATGNNLTFRTGSDTSRRTCLIRLDSGEAPEERTGFAHADIIGHVQEHRRELLSAALVVLRAWLFACAHGAKMPHHAKPWGSFEAWSKVVRGAVLYAGLPDPGEARGSQDEQADAEVEAIGSLLDGVREIVYNLAPDKGLTSAEISHALTRDALQGGSPRWEKLRSALEELHTGRALPFSTKAIAYLFRRLRGRPVHGYRLAAHTLEGAQYWGVESAKRPHMKGKVG